jgi:hypothetical protein
MNKQSHGNKNISTGSISVRNDGCFLSQFRVCYYLGKHRFTQHSGLIKKGKTQKMLIPAEAENVCILLEQLVKVHPELWREISELNYPYAGNREYRVWGTLHHPRFGSMIPKHEKA